MIEKTTIAFSLTAVLGVVILLNGLGLVSASIIGQFPGAPISVGCQRTPNTNDVSCAFDTTQLNSACSPNDPAKSTFNYCTFSALGADFPLDIQKKINEMGELTPDEKQFFFDNLELTGDCKLGFTNGVSKLVDGSCGYSSQFINGKTYLGLGCTNKDLSKCEVTYVNPSCGTPSGKPTGREEIQVYFGNKDVPGTCGLKTKLPPKQDRGIMIYAGAGLLAISALGLLITKRR